ncbi:glycoside hydrolase family 43 protein [Apiospora aurea]|uniref:Glycoside hydrolase family 43 protein n=1 Tax=Apiospora aurea TaxID=335848 RepID=A0ABR1QRZ2_9PEZI
MDHSCQTLTSVSTPDPFMVYANGNYYLTFTSGNKIEIWASRNLESFEETARKEIIWTPPPGTAHSADLWAPELHALYGRWYIYYAAAHPKHGNKSRRMYVLGGPPAHEDPTQGQWEFLGRIHGMPDQWAIDGTVFVLHGELYMVYSGWPLDNHDGSDLVQQLFIMKLDDPTMAADGCGGPVVISTPEQPWEFSRDGNGDHGINEGPQFLSSPDGAWKGIVYSCAGSWTHEYKLAVLHYSGGDPLDPRAWPKGQEPLLQAGWGGKGPYGPGHGNFVSLGGGTGSAGGDTTLCVFHGTDDPADGWSNRKARCQQVFFTAGGPYMGLYCGGTGHATKAKAREGGLMARIRRKLNKRKKRGSPLQALTALLEGH